MDLQAIRYAAMVSAMTFEELIVIYARFLKSQGELDHSPDVAESTLLDWIDEVEDDAPVISREVRIVLVSANFSAEITTTVLWLDEFSGLDIRCVRLTPYAFEGRLLLDVQQVIPLPEAEELMVRLKRREAAAKQAKSESAKDYTKFVVTDSSGSSEALPKRWAMLELVKRVQGGGVPAQQIADAIPHAKLRSVDGQLTGDELWESLREAHDLGAKNFKRWHVDDPIHEAGKTWVLSNQWGNQTLGAMVGVMAIAPPGVRVTTEAGELVAASAHKSAEPAGPPSDGLLDT